MEFVAFRFKLILDLLKQVACPLEQDCFAVAKILLTLNRFLMLGFIAGLINSLRPQRVVIGGHNTARGALD